MEIDDPQDSSSNNDFLSIETGLQSMEINDEVGMSNESCFPIGNSENSHVKELNESEKAILQFQKEREATFSRNCLFCKQQFFGKRSLILDHLVEWHHLFLGQSDNLVYVNEFLDILESMLSKLQCIYCEKVFKDWSALKEHMRKKMHKRINPNNKMFDKFYMTNYLNMFNNVECESSQDDTEEREISIEPEENAIICLFCDGKYPDFDEVGNHLEAVHGFDFKLIRNLSFYSQVKLINYIRQKVLAKECPICETTFNTKESLAGHMKFSRHISLMPKEDKWNRPEYFFPTLEADYLLCSLDVNEDNSDEDIQIISEIVPFPQSSVLIDENLRKELL